jgi:thiol-disulfide isomerase/thioredoxin
MRFTHFVLVLSFVLSAFPASSPTEAVWVPQEQRSAGPKLELSDIPGRKQQLSSLKGNVIVVNFWATWCVPCKMEMPEITRAYAAYHDRGVAFLGAAYEERSGRPKVQAFMKTFEMQFPVWLEASEGAMKLFGVGPGVPATIILDSQHRIAARIPGPTDEAQLAQLIDRVLSEEAAVR